MKTHLSLVLFLFINVALSAQQKTSFLIRSYWDNDFFNVRGHGTDEAYTNGFRFDLFYQQRKAPRSWISRLLPIAGDGSINLRGWGFGQMMMTPTDLTRTDFQPFDYSYAGALVGIHSLYSYNQKKRYAFQTEVMLGVRGPDAFGAQTQIFIHRLIGDQRPMGWHNQLSDKFIVNIKFTAEKELLHCDNRADAVIGVQALGGTLFSQVAVFITWRIGKIESYFNGYISQHSSTRKMMSWRSRCFQAYLIARPSAGIILDNDMIIEHPTINNDDTQHPVPSVERWSINLEYGIEISAGHIGLSFIQKSLSSMLTGLPRHEVGNVSMYYSW